MDKKIFLDSLGFKEDSGVWTSSERKKFKYNNALIKVTDEIRAANTEQEAFENWLPRYFDNTGFFEAYHRPYELVASRRKKDLRPLTSEDGNLIFNRFAEILRRNVVSDKTNAYNKIFNLFLCKIVDESEKDEEDILEFQWGDNESAEDVLLRLISLYKRGMKEYLDLEIADVDVEEIESYLSDGNNAKVKELFKQQKLYTNNEFAFKEVFDHNTFELNCVVLIEKTVIN